MANLRIPKGYKRAGLQAFKSYEECRAVIDDYCSQCAVGCSSRAKLSYDIINQTDFWDPNLLRVNPEKQKKGLVEKVLCTIFKPA